MPVKNTPTALVNRNMEGMTSTPDTLVLKIKILLRIRVVDYDPRFLNERVGSKLQLKGWL